MSAIIKRQEISVGLRPTSGSQGSASAQRLAAAQQQQCPQPALGIGKFTAGLTE